MDTTSNTTLGDLARDNPAAVRVFLRHRIDFCCRGQRSLAEACGAAGLDAATIAQEIRNESSRSDDVALWGKRSPTELADHIEAHYHAALWRDVPALIAAAARVERVHAGKPDVPVGLADLLASTWRELQLHMAKEENILFPLIRRGGSGRAVYMPVRAMEQDHASHGEALARIREIAHQFEPPPHACATWRGLYAGLEALEADLMQHIHLENNILFLRAARDDG